MANDQSPTHDIRVLICEPLADAGVALLEEHFTVESGVGWSREELLARVGEFEVLIVRSATKVNAEMIQAATALRVVGRAGTGVDNVDVEAATRRGIIVCNAAGSNALSAAEHTIALLLAQARNVAQAHAALVDGRWERSKFGGIELDGKTLGILGFGRIGQMVGERAQGLGMRVLAYDPYVAESRYRDMGVDRAETPEDVYRASDFITLHLASTPETRGFINAAALAQMRPGARLLNVARGDLVDQEALAEAIRSGHLAGAGIDVFPEEPCTESPLFGLPGVVVTPHLGASTAEAQDRAGVAVAEQVTAALTGGVVTSAVNIPAVSAHVLEVIGPYLPLAREMGQLIGELAGGAVSPLKIDFEGEIAGLDTRLLSSAVIAGRLERARRRVGEPGQRRLAGRGAGDRVDRQLVPADPRLPQHAHADHRRHHGLRDDHRGDLAAAAHGPARVQRRDRARRQHGGVPLFGCPGRHRTGRQHPRRGRCQHRPHGGGASRRRGPDGVDRRFPGAERRPGSRSAAWTGSSASGL